MSALPSGIIAQRLPRHVAVIMDGNGRWALGQGQQRPQGHRQGAETVRMVIRQSAMLGIEHLTLYTFSSENWQRPPEEVAFLMALLGELLRQEIPTLQDNNVQLHAIGRLHRLPQEVRDLLHAGIAETASNTGLRVYLALSYGGRDEIVDACRQLAQQVAAGSLCPEDIDEAAVQGALYAPTVPDVDLVLRTAGEQRLSNFLPWQSAYAEFTSVAPLWPELSAEDYHAALAEFCARDRRFGGVTSTSGPKA